MKNIILILLLYLPPIYIYANQSNFIQGDSTAIVQTALDYGDGYYSGDASRMEKALHPDFIKVAPMKMSGNGNTILYHSTYSGLIEMTGAKMGFLEEEKRKEKVTVLRIDNDMAFAKINTAMFNDYLEMAKINGQWKIINVLWTKGSDSPQKNKPGDYNFDEEKNLVKLAVSDLYEGIYTGDASKIDKSVHIEYNNAILTAFPNNIVVINKTGFSIIREVAQSKMQLLDKDKWNLQIDVLDIMDDLAAVGVSVNSNVTYLQLAKMDGQWKIINSLKKSVK
jgi:hypothetical protein